MYGTCARTRVKPENRDQLVKVFESQSYDTQVKGFVKSYVLFEDGSDAAWMFAVFTDKESYDANAHDPKQHERYMEYRALLEEEPEWHDGEITEG